MIPRPKSLLIFLVCYFLIPPIELRKSGRRYGHSSESYEYRRRQEQEEEDQRDAAIESPPPPPPARREKSDSRYAGDGNVANGYGSRSREYYSHRNRKPFQPPEKTDIQQDMCPCVRRNDTGECVTYDPRFQAVSVEEAILNFPDLQIGPGGTRPGAPDGSTGLPPKPPPPGEGGIGPPSAPGQSEFGPQATSDNLTISGPSLAKSRVGSRGAVPQERSSNANISTSSPGLCGEDKECQECSSALLSRLSRSGLLANDDYERVSKRLGVQGQPTLQSCSKYRFGSPPQAFSRKGGNPRNLNVTPEDAQLNKLIQVLQQKGQEVWSKETNTTTRIKRQPKQALGQQYKIDCSKRGEPVEQGSSWVGLCNVCWAWRKLPSTYFPQYINELICDSDRKCMSGWAKCQQRYKSVDILQNTGTKAKPKWKQVTISVANYCDCEVESGSGMHNFVAA